MVLIGAVMVLLGAGMVLTSVRVRVRVVFGLVLGSVEDPLNRLTCNS